jgi:hypothetical protein
MYEISPKSKVTVNNYAFNAYKWDIKYAPVEILEKENSMDYSIIEKKSQVIHLRKLLKMRIKRVTKAKSKGWEVAVKSMTSSLEAVQNELAMRKMYGNDWNNRKGGKDGKS